MMTTTPQIIEAPCSDAYRAYETLGYVDAYDAVLNCDYAFVAYKETEKDSGKWRVIVKSSQTAGGMFAPAMIRNKAREAGAHGKEFFLWGYSFESSPSDPRQIEFRVYQRNGLPVEMEIYLVLRLANGAADAAKSVRFPWPQS
jgi:hypothetical protein